MIIVEAYLKRQHFTLDVKVAFPEKVTAIFGPSGSGKTTFINVVAGIVTPESGLVTVDGQCLFDSKKKINTPLHKRKIGLVFQDHRLFPHMPVIDNLTYGMKMKSDEANISVNHVIELLELTALLKQLPYQLSGGEKQRVALGRALLSSPSLLLLDEPLASLDERLKQQILPYLKLISQDIKIPMIYISHSLKETHQITSNVVNMQRGQFIE